MELYLGMSSSSNLRAGLVELYLLHVAYIKSSSLPSSFYDSFDKKNRVESGDPLFILFYSLLFSYELKNLISKW